MKKMRLLTVIMILTMVLVGCGGFSEGVKDGMNDAMNEKTEAEVETAVEETEEQTQEEAVAQEEPVSTEPEVAEEEQTAETSNVLLTAPVTEYEVKNGTKTEVIGKRAEVVFDKELAKALTNEEFVEFCYTVVDGSGYNWVTISFGDGTGIVFAGSNPSMATYGEIDEEGALLEGKGYIMAYESGTVNYSE